VKAEWQRVKAKSLAKRLKFDKNDPRKLELLKDSLDAVGPGFCLAKWTQVTTHLGSGITHSCHHVGAHKIKLDELEKDPGALHNTEFKKERRQEMLNGERPVECDYCWRIEDNSNHFSDRITKSIQDWSIPYLHEIMESKGNENIFPKYVEISFSNVCNFKCAYCGPAFSSKWTEEVKEKGTYKYTDYKGNKREFGFINPDEVQYLEREHNPYIEAFWKWFPEAVKHMHVFRITGGEPLLSKHTMKVIDYLLENPQPNLEFAINTNACPPHKIWKSFINKINILEDTKSIKSFTIYTSAEAKGEQNNYVRFGMDYDLWLKNLKMLVSNTKSVKLSIMCAVNMLSTTTLHLMINDINDLRKHSPTITMDFAYVRNPKFLDIMITPRKILDRYMKKIIKTLQDAYDSAPTDQWPNESEKIMRIYNSVIELQNKADPKDLQLTRYNFVEYITEYDKRRGTNFKQTFPEFVSYFDEWAFVNV
tara:strand:- start:22136 stop:23569 length:1434 start_codon:yes stop_codon:yes gene_type:complete